MKMAMTALAVVFLAQAAPALAQERGERGDRGDRQERLEQRDRPQRDGSGGGRPQRERGPDRVAPAPEAVQAPQAQPAPRAAEPRRAEGDRARFRGDGRTPGVTDRRGDGDARGGDGRRDDGRRDGDRRDGDRRDWDGRRDNDRRDWNSRGDNDRRDWDRRDDRRDNHRRWERGRYPPAYFSSHRYRYSWRPPSGFYLRNWSYGEFLPRGWYGAGYWIVDPWQYDLPLPPPGFDWVRSGPDALLIDQFSGRIVQVVRNVFWY